MISKFMLNIILNIVFELEIFLWKDMHVLMVDIEENKIKSKFQYSLG